MKHIFTKVEDGNTILYRPFLTSISTINVSKPNPAVCRDETMISIGSQILNIADMKHFAESILKVCKEAENG
jgi:hypothetical protein